MPYFLCNHLEFSVQLLNQSLANLTLTGARSTLQWSIPVTRVSDMMVGAVNLKQTPSFPSATQHVLTEVTSMEC